MTSSSVAETKAMSFALKNLGFKCEAMYRENYDEKIYAICANKADFITNFATRKCSPPKSPAQEPSKAERRLTNK
ncbi:unnamed protein product [Clavelina lepadiformis]|uniref:Uncharacterized protein n=1 Tax=Clavelina lepadiformis TaxID=159417 RepID=A0ABP0GCG6_CLALP